MSFRFCCKLLVLALALSGCGGGSDEIDTKSEGKTPGSANPDKSPSAPVESTETEPVTQTKEPSDTANPEREMNEQADAYGRATVLKQIDDAIAESDDPTLMSVPAADTPTVSLTVKELIEMTDSAAAEQAMVARFAGHYLEVTGFAIDFRVSLAASPSREIVLSDSPDSTTHARKFEVSPPPWDVASLGDKATVRCNIEQDAFSLGLDWTVSSSTGTPVPRMTVTELPQYVAKFDAGSHDKPFVIVSGVVDGIDGDDAVVLRGDGDLRIKIYPFDKQFDGVNPGDEIVVIGSVHTIPSAAHDNDTLVLPFASRIDNLDAH